MNARVRKHIDSLFEGRVMDKRTLELRDELLDNCAERFDDYMAEGLGEDEAMERIVDSLGDLDQLLGEAAAPMHDEPSGIEARYDIRAIRSIKVSLRSLALALEPIEGDTLMIAFEGPEKDFEEVRYSLEDGVLKIKQTPLSLLSLIFSWKTPSKIRVGVPESALLNYTLDCAIGGISSSVKMLKGRLSSVSGILNVVQPGEHICEKMSMTCQSGRIAAHGNYGKLKIDVTSGHVDVRGAVYELRCNAVSGTQQLFGRFGQVDLSAISGKIALTGSVDTAKLNTTSGTITMALTNRDPKSIDAHMISGSLNLELPRDIAGFTAKHSAVSGRLRNAFAANPYGDGSTLINCEAVSGALRITEGAPATSEA